MTIESLTTLANTHGSDKGTVGPSAHWAGHNYTDIYEAYLERVRGTTTAVLEIGLGVLGDRWDARIVHGRNAGGASFKMWQDYFSNAVVSGIDINACPYLDGIRSKTYVVDQGSMSDLQAFATNIGLAAFDLIIDDGSHRPDHQQLSLGYFFPLLKSGGLYFIEDLAANGLGDGVVSRHATDTVINTRKLLKGLQQSGQLQQPHAIVNPDYLVGAIDFINFHCPQRSVVTTPGGKLVDVYAPDTEQLCAIQKKSDSLR